MFSLAYHDYRDNFYDIMDVIQIISYCGITIERLVHKHIHHFVLNHAS